MMKMEERMKNSPKGTIFTNSDFYDISNPDAVKMPLHRQTAVIKYTGLSVDIILSHTTVMFYMNMDILRQMLWQKSLLRSMHGIFVRLEWYPSKRSFIHVIGHDMI
ncbi:hypothetical protein MKD05_07305 [[Clostridium] innocuum]|nr:hypothetical protein [[Clostridium] innocuum]